MQEKTLIGRAQAFLRGLFRASTPPPATPASSPASRADDNSLTVSEFLEMPDDTRKFVNFMMREREITVSQAVAHTGQSVAEVRAKLQYLLDRGLVREMPNPGEMRYRVRILHKQNRRVSDDTWRRLEDEKRK